MNKAESTIWVNSWGTSATKGEQLGTLSQKIRDLGLAELPDGLDVAIMLHESHDIVGQNIGVGIGSGMVENLSATC